MAVYSRTNGWMAAAAGSGLFALLVVEGLQGNSVLAALWGTLGMLLALQAADDLAWHGSQDRVVVPLKRVLAAVTLLLAAWALLAWLA